MSKKWKPHPYQLKGLDLVARKPAAGLFLRPGLGKTSIMLAALEQFIHRGVVGGALIVAPLRVVYNVWPAEIAKWKEFEHITYSIVHGKESQRIEALEEEADIYLTNPENVPWLATQRWWTPPNMLVLDESTKFKNTRAKRSKALKKFITDGVFDRRYCLTGTPAPNGYEDLFGQIYVLDLGRALGAYITHYRLKYFIQSFDGFSWILRQGAEKEIQKKIKSFVMYMEPGDYIKVPPLSLVHTMVRLPKKAMDQYRELEDQFILELKEGDVNALTAGTLGTKLRQIANGRVYTTNETGTIHDAKLEALRDLHEELAGNPLLVAYEFKHDRDRICGEFDCPALGGTTTSVQAAKYINQWNAGELPMLAVHPASGGHGLNLQQGGSNLCFYGLPWDLELYDQMIHRIWRQGQRRKVFVYHLLAKDTIDERVMQVLEKKNHTQRDLLRAFKRK